MKIPNHVLARHYLHAAEQDIINEIKKMIYSAQKAVVAGRLKKLKAIMRLQ